MKPFLVAAACVLPAFASLAQDNEHLPPPAHCCGDRSEIVAGHGLLPSEQMFSGGGNRLSYHNEHYTGALFVTYRYHVSDVVSLGMTVAFENEQGTWNDNRYGWFGGPTVRLMAPGGKFRRSSYTFAPEITFNYADYANGLVRLYSTAGMGYTYRNEMITNGNVNVEYNTPYAKRVHFNAYGSPIAIRVGRELSGFFELGLGYKGVFNYGLTYRF